jgi:hypothetical protein
MPQPHIVAQPAADISLEEKLAFLRNPPCYPQCIFKIETIETHMSWVFLTDDNAYKLKKPIRHDIFDFRTIEARKHFCEEEVRLNRRLAKDVYLAVVPLCRIASGELRPEHVCIHARLAAQHLDEAQESNRGKWITQAFDYLGLAERHQACASAVSEPPS